MLNHYYFELKEVSMINFPPHKTSYNKPAYGLTKFKTLYN